jgi:6-pyruvoyltetrahydropterin/6-carboxytetrahydropterin synthase
MDVTISGPLIVSGSATGMVMDFSDLSDVVKSLVVDALDHTHLNDCIENPTCENLLVWMWSRLAAPLPGLDEIEVWETASARASLRREDAETRVGVSS